MPAPEADLDLLTRAALSAGEIALRFFRGKAKVWDKADNQGPVSEADLAVNDHLRDLMGGARPGYGWMSEESDPLGDQSRLGAETLFIVDPIDGTRAFLDGQPGWAHALAVVQGGVPLAAVVHLPALGLTYAARAGAGATLNGAPIAATTCADPEGATALTTRAALDPAFWPGGVPGLVRHFRPSLAWRLALVGEGRFDAMLTLRDAWDWDIAASALIASEAGALVTDLSGAALAFNSPGARSPGILAAPPGLHAALRARMAAPRGAPPVPVFAPPEP